MKNVDSVLQFADSAIIGRINYEMRTYQLRNEKGTRKHF